MVEEVLVVGYENLWLGIEEFRVFGSCFGLDYDFECYIWEVENFKEGLIVSISVVDML